jgi:hypothetical protein
MRTFTVVTRTTPQPLPTPLSLLDARVRAEEPSAPGEYVGHTEGVMLDESSNVVAFVVRLSVPLAGHRPPWTLIPTNAVGVLDDGTLQTSWTEDQLLAQPRLDAHFQPHERVDGGLPVESQFLPARPNPVPPGSGVNAPEALREGAAGGAIGAAVGAVAGLVAAGPLGAAALGVFFAAGGSLAGLLSGGSHDSAVQAAELEVDTQPRVASGPMDARLRALEEELRRPGAVSAAGLRATQFDLVSTDQEGRRIAS